MSEQKKYTNILSSDGEKESPSLIKHDDLLTDDILLNKVISDFSVGARTNRTMNLYCENCNFFFFWQAIIVKSRLSQNPSMC